MRIGIHIAPHAPEAQAVAAGCLALGWRTAWRSGNHHTDGQTEKFDAIVVDGLRGNRHALIADYAAIGVPAIVIDFGYLHRADENSSEGYWSVGLGKLGWVPEFDCPADRWKALGLTLAPKSKGDVTIIAGQMIGDSNHPFADVAATRRWALDRGATIAGQAVFRPHPRSPDVVGDDDMAVDTLPLAKSLARASKVITWSSNIGHDALLAGVEVESNCGAPYQGVTLATRETYFRRLAYAQWTLAEIASGEALAFVIDPKVPTVQKDADSAQKETSTEPRRRKLSLNKAKA